MKLISAQNKESENWIELNNTKLDYDRSIRNTVEFYRNVSKCIPHASFHPNKLRKDGWHYAKGKRGKLRANDGARCAADFFALSRNGHKKEIRCIFYCRAPPTHTNNIHVTNCVPVGTFRKRLCFSFYILYFPRQPKAFETTDLYTFSVYDHFSFRAKHNDGKTKI